MEQNRSLACRNYYKQVGKIVGPNDLLIGAIVKFHNGILVTNNINEFENIDGIRLENWL